jgi:predicted amidohydrolase
MRLSQIAMLLAGTFAVGLALAGDATLTLAGLRLTPKAWDKQANFETLEHYARQAAAEGAQLVITPEGFLEGYLWNEYAAKDLPRQRYFDVGETIDGPILSRSRALARELKIYLAVGFAERRDEKMYNSVVVFSPGGDIVTRYSKTHTANDEPFNTKGTEFPVFDTSLGRWATLICMDRQLPETSRILAIKGAQIILVPAWGMYGEMNDIMMRTRAYENGVFVAFVHPKRCLIIGPSGKIIAQDHGSGDEIVMARVQLSDHQNAESPIQYRRPEIYQELLKSKE